MQQDAHFILNKRHSLGQKSGTERWGGATSGYSFVAVIVCLKDLGGHQKESQGDGSQNEAADFSFPLTTSSSRPGPECPGKEFFVP